MKHYLLVFFGGGLGAAARYWMSGAAHRVLPADFPYGTMIVNIVGSLLIGMVMGVFDERSSLSPALRVFLTIGILGGFTTFSSFSYETIALLRSGDMLRAVLNVVGTLSLGLAATFIGWTVVKFMYAKMGVM